MWKRFLSLFIFKQPVVVPIDALLMQFQALEPRLIRRKYRYAEHGLIEIKMRTKTATELYERLVKVRDSLRTDKSIRPFELGTLKPFYLDDYLVVEEGLAVDLVLYFQSLKEVAIELLTLLQESAQTQEAEYYRVRTQLLMDDLKTLIDTVLKL
jgi:hypothetical protein